MARPKNTAVNAEADVQPQDATTPEATEVIGDAYPQDVAQAKVMAVRSRSGHTFWRGGCCFGAEFTVLYRADLANDRDWMRIATESMLEVREVVLRPAGVGEDAPQ